MRRLGLAIFTSRAGQLFLFLLAGGAISVWRRQDVNWDLQNYHFYNPWAWLNGRLDFDLAPAQIQTYLNPLLDIPFYLLVQAGVAPVAIGFVMGIPFGIALAFFFWIVRFVTQPLPRAQALTVTVLTLLVGLTGAAGLPTVGSTMNEWHATALVMPAAFIALRLSTPLAPARASIAWASAGFLLGIAAGLKLTAVPYGLAVAIAAALMRPFASRAQLNIVATLAWSGIAGFAVAYGYWAMVLTHYFASPVFPFFNAIFQSPDWFASSFRDRFGPTTVVEGLLFPLRLAERSTVASNVTQRDPRLLLLAVSLILVACTAAIRKARGERMVMPPLGRSVAFLLIFTTAAYLIWLIQFSIYRYFIPAELTGSLLLVLSLWFLLESARWRVVLVSALCLVIVLYTDRPQWGRKPFGDSYFGVSAPSIPARSLVLLYGGEPLAYVIPFLGPSHRYVRPSSNFTHPSHSHGLQRNIRKAIEDHAGTMYALRKPDQDLVDEARVLQAYRLTLADEPCLPIRSDIHPGLALCRLARASD